MSHKDVVRPPLEVMSATFKLYLCLARKPYSKASISHWIRARKAYCV